MAHHHSPSGAGDGLVDDATSGEPLRLSVVIATYNRPDLLEKLLAQLEKQTLPSSSFEVIVIDDGSAPPIEPQLKDKPRSLQLRVLSQANAGAAAARHAGAVQ